MIQMEHINPGITPAYAGKSLCARTGSPAFRDHPRICGEKSISRPKSGPSTGSPPHMRGKGIGRFDRDDRIGITPAYAGKRYLLQTASFGLRDHPRICGEKSFQRRSESPPSGSPPHMRGKDIRNFTGKPVHRITPAYAGKSIPPNLPRHRALGSPPRMRGKVEKYMSSEIEKRITPAYAGKRAFDAKRRNPTQDHPRVCGEKPVCPCICGMYWGSPPRMRGKDVLVCPDLIVRGITPAYAGKRTSTGRAARANGDHPRVCGEKSLHPVSELLTPGSPPRMRGKEGHRQRPGVPAGITPAYAGKRTVSKFYTVIKRDHPRVCGEKSPRRFLSRAAQGSPPRMRGKAPKY